MQEYQPPAASGIRIRSLVESIYESEHGEKLAHGTCVRIVSKLSTIHGQIGQIIGLADWSMILGQLYIVELPHGIKDYGYTAFVISEADIEVVKGVNSAELFRKRLENIKGLRPYMIDGKAYTSFIQNVHGMLIAKDVLVNTPDNVYLTKDDWRVLDATVIHAARPELPVFSALVSAGCHESAKFDAAKTIMRDVYPLPIFDANFTLTARQLLACTDKTQLNLVEAEAAVKIVADKVERLLLGVDPVQEFYGLPLYGLCNHPNRWTLTVNSADSIHEILDRIVTGLIAKGIDDGNFLVILSSDWDVAVNDIKTPKITEAVVSKHLPDNTLVVVEMSSATITAFSDLDILTVLWKTGGFFLDMKVICRMLPFIRERCGVAVVTVENAE